VNVSDIRTRCQRIFGDDANIQLLDSDVISWINDAQRQIAVQTELLQVRAVTDVVAGVMDYDKPSNILNLRSVRNNGIKLQGLSLAEADDQFPLYDQTANQETGQPLFYWSWGTHLSIYPVPTASQSGGLTMLYTRQPVPVVLLTDVPELPEMYHDQIISYVLKTAYEMDDDIQSATYRGTIFTTQMSITQEHEDRVNEEAYPVLGIRMEDY
jgi:hypothetical protein